jgi:hypothetical protein
MPFESYRVHLQMKFPRENASHLVRLGFKKTNDEDYYLEGSKFVIEARNAHNEIKLEYAYDNHDSVDERFLEIMQSIWPYLELVINGSGIDKKSIEFDTDVHKQFVEKFRLEISRLRWMWVQNFGYRGDTTLVKDAYNRFVK